MKRHIAGLVALGVVGIVMLSAGSAAIGARLITSRDIRNGSIRPVDLNANLQDAVPNAGVISGNAVVVSGEQRFAPVSGAGDAFTDETEAATLTPDHYITIDSFSAQVRTPFEFESIAVKVVVDGVETGFGCTIVAPAETCDAAGQSISIRERRTMSVKLTVMGGTGTTVVTWGGRLLEQL